MSFVTNAATFRTGVIVAKSLNAFTLRAADGCIPCTLSARLRLQSGPDPVAVGDVVTVNEAAQITSVLPRRNQLSRRSPVAMPSAFAPEQVIVANVDLAVLVVAAAQPRPAWHLLDRYLVSAESAGIPALICLTKMDLVEGSAHADEIEVVMQEYEVIGYDVVLTSAATGRGVDYLKTRLRGKVSALLGKSGVGKTSLLNAVEPGLGRKVQAISAASGKGRHTTSSSEMVALTSGGALVDTPGVREFGMWDVEGDDLAWFFPEMRPFVGRCKFRLDCRHDSEPDCAIRQAVMDGQISPYRYQSYLRLRAEP